jgi:hypothetical protein
MVQTKINRVFAMPNKNTFDIIPIKKLLHKYIKSGLIVVDPFANKSKFGSITNDLNPEFDTDYHLDFEIFLQKINIADIILIDPPFSPRQITECYRGFGLKATQKDTQGFYSRCWEQILRISPKLVIQFGWHSNGRKKNYDLIELLIVNHGSQHNDTLVTVWRKKNLILSKYI